MVKVSFFLRFPLITRSVTSPGPVSIFAPHQFPLGECGGCGDEGKGGGEGRAGSWWGGGGGGVRGGRRRTRGVSGRSGLRKGK